ncbi:MAG TPA: CDP-alcohol phosphatidyltransferase family protein [Gaiellaceae bacterium]|nr:CDP-alcohol phosphatidyltransferase family protein [Gaiellaceae bacterium]
MQEWLCEWTFRPLAHLVVLVLAPLRVPPPAVVLAAGAAGIAGAVELARGHLVVAALLVQLKTVLDNADGQLARLTDRVTLLGRYLDSEVDLVVNAALFAAIGWYADSPLAAAAGFVALTGVLSLNFNVERLYRGGALTTPEAHGVTAVLQRAYAFAYGWQDAVVERFVERRLRGASEQVRVAYHDRMTVAVFANLGMSSQLAAFGVCVGLGHPLAFVWLVLGELALAVLLMLRRETLVRGAVFEGQPGGIA